MPCILLRSNAHSWRNLTPGSAYWHPRSTFGAQRLTFGGALWASFSFVPKSFSFPCSARTTVKRKEEAHSPDRHGNTTFYRNKNFGPTNDRSDGQAYPVGLRHRRQIQCRRFALKCSGKRPGNG